jgi:hypothetical protein
MATLAANNLTLADVAKTLNPDGSSAVIAELLNQRNEVLDDIPWVKCNKLDAHQYSLRTSLPTAPTRGPNEGVTPTATSTAQATEVTAVFEDWSITDQLVAGLGGNLGANLRNELIGKLESMNQGFTNMLFSGNHTTTPRSFNGFTVRQNSTTAGNGVNVLLGAGAGSDNSSIWLVGWGENKVYGIYPDNGSAAGVQHKDWGLGPVTSSSTAGLDQGILAAYRNQLQWQCGLAVQDWRYVVRCANIDLSDLKAGSGADLPLQMIRMWHRIPTFGTPRKVYYMNRTVFQELDRQCRKNVQDGGQLTYEVVAGKPMIMFRDAAVRVVDQLGIAEALAA